jgi:hypothetical protein
VEGGGEVGHDGLGCVSLRTLLDHPSPSSLISFTLRYGHGLTLLSPYTTDPVSSKVLSMIEYYEAHPLPEDDNFGNVAIYIRK